MPYFQNQTVNGQVGPGSVSFGQSGAAQRNRPDFRYLLRAPSKNTTPCRRPCTSVSAWDWNTRWRSPTRVACPIPSATTARAAQAGSQSAYWQNLFNQQSEFGPTYFDEKFNFVPSFVYHLPFGRGRKFGKGWNKGIDAFVGGWQLGGVLHRTYRLPADHQTCERSLGNRTPAATVPKSSARRTIRTRLDPALPGWMSRPITTPALHTFGDAGVGIVRGPGEFRLDLSLAKQFHITEQKYFELRGGGLRPDQHADLLQPGVADHYFHPLRTDSQLRRRTQYAGSGEVLLLVLAEIGFLTRRRREAEKPAEKATGWFLRAFSASPRPVLRQR